MASDKQIEANRRNAQLSTGPNTDEGKEEAKYNAGKHFYNAAEALLPWEDPEEYAAHCDRYFRTYPVSCEVQAELILKVAENNWRIRRGKRYELTVYQTSRCRKELEEELIRLSGYESRLIRNNARFLQEYRRLRDEIREGILVPPGDDWRPPGSTAIQEPKEADDTPPATGDTPTHDAPAADLQPETPETTAPEPSGQPDEAQALSTNPASNPAEEDTPESAGEPGETHAPSTAKPVKTGPQPDLELPYDPLDGEQLRQKREDLLMFAADLLADYLPNNADQAYLNFNIQATPQSDTPRGLKPTFLLNRPCNQPYTLAATVTELAHHAFLGPLLERWRRLDVEEPGNTEPPPDT